jgi:glycosyltransferase involved in cell wall biosynthesis
MRLLLATDYYPPFIGGAQIQSRVLARELHARGHEVSVVTPWQKGIPEIRDDDGVTVFGVRQLRTLRWFEPRNFVQQHQPPFPDPVSILAIRRIMRRVHPDVVHSFGWIGYSCAVALAGRRTPLVAVARDYAYGCANRTLMRDGRECSGPALAKCVPCAGRNYGAPRGWIAALGVLASRPLLRRRIDAMHSISEYVQLMMRRDFLGGAVVEDVVIHDIIETAGPGAPSDALLDLLPKEPFILFVGALRRIKGIAELIAAHACLNDPPPLVLIGTVEPDTPSIPASVTVIRDAPHSVVMEAWERSLFGVFPSQFPEPLGTVVCEGMSRGKPVIGTAPGGHTDMIVDGLTGLLVPRHDVDALAAAMQRLIEDSSLRGRLGAEARLRARDFTAAASIPRLEALYARLLGGSG